MPTAVRRGWRMDIPRGRGGMNCGVGLAPVGWKRTAQGATKRARDACDAFHFQLGWQLVRRAHGAGEENDAECRSVAVLDRHSCASRQASGPKCSMINRATTSSSVQRRDRFLRACEGAPEFGYVPAPSIRRPLAHLPALGFLEAAPAWQSIQEGRPNTPVGLRVRMRTAPTGPGLSSTAVPARAHPSMGLRRCGITFVPVRRYDALIQWIAARVLPLGLLTACQAEPTTPSGVRTSPAVATAAVVDDVVASLGVIPDSQMVFVGDQFQITARPKNKAGQVLGKSVRWTVTNTSVVSAVGSPSDDDVQGPPHRQDLGQGHGRCEVEVRQRRRPQRHGREGGGHAGGGHGGKRRNGAVRRHRT